VERLVVDQARRARRESFEVAPQAFGIATAISGNELVNVALEPTLTRGIGSGERRFGNPLRSASST
jgi:hypothetical protein